MTAFTVNDTSGMSNYRVETTMRLPTRETSELLASNFY